MKHEVIVEEAKAKVEYDIVTLSNLVEEAPILNIIATNPGDGPSEFYIRQKIKDGEAFGVDVHVHRPEPDEIIPLLRSLRNNLRNKIIIQAPMGEGYPPFRKLLPLIHPLQDVDGFSITMEEISTMRTPEAFLGCPNFSPTAKGVLQLHLQLEKNLKGRNVTVIGKGLTSGLPITMMFNQLGSTVTTVSTSTKEHARFKAAFTADTIVSCAGAPVNLLDPKLFLGKLCINVGMRRVDGELVGDFDYEAIKDRAHFINPVKGSTGKLTTLNLIFNCYLSQMKCEGGRYE